MFKFKTVVCLLILFVQISSACKTVLIIPEEPEAFMSWVGTSLELTGKFPWHGQAVTEATKKKFYHKLKDLKYLRLLSERALQRINFEGALVREDSIYEKLSEDSILQVWVMKLWNVRGDETIVACAIGKRIKQLGKEKIESASGPFYNQFRDQTQIIEWLKA